MYKINPAPESIDSNNQNLNCLQENNPNIASMNSNKVSEIENTKSNDLVNASSPAVNSQWKPFDYISNPAFASMINFRWNVLFPFQKRIWIFTIGEYLILAALAGAMAYQIIFSWPVINGTATTSSSSGSKPRGGDRILDDDGVGGYVKETGVLPEIALAMVFITACRNSILTFLLGIPFERALFWHKAFSILAIASGAWHGFIALYGEGDDDDDHFMTGYVCEGSMIAMMVLAFYPIRRLVFELFHAIHLILMVATVASGFLHGAGLFAFGLALFGLDIIIRYFYVAYRNPTNAVLEQVTNDMVSVTFPRGEFSFTGGQYVFICIPKLSIFQWHPISISSGPDDEYVTLHISCLGSWSKAVHELANKSPNVSILVDGAYGEPAVSIWGSRYKHFVFVAGGIGVTPIRSCIRRMIQQRIEHGRPLEKITLIWVLRSKETIPSLIPVDPNDAPFVDIRIHLTRNIDVEDHNSTMAKLIVDGRPNMKEALQGIRETTPGSERVAVFACGPVSLIDATRKACTWSSKFDFHSETFEF